ncbi:MAG: hypothetical protein RML57_10240 [Acidobacteriota bacterium]|nr:hypothetical protein [Acidobacteriota bacterium]
MDHPAEAKSKMTVEALVDIKEILASPQGSCAYKEIHQMVNDKPKIAIHDSKVHHLVRYKLGAKAKVPRPSHPKKRKSGDGVQSRSWGEIQGVGRKYHEIDQSVRWWVEDEARLGLTPIHRKSITAQGARARVRSEIKRAYGY